MAERIFKLLQVRQRALMQTLSQLGARVKALGDPQPDDLERITEKEIAVAQQHQAQEDFGEVMNFPSKFQVNTLYFGLSFKRGEGIPHSPIDRQMFEIISRILRGYSRIGSLRETYEKASGHIQMLTVERAAIGHQVYLIKVEQNLDGLKSHLHRDIEHREFVQTIYDTFTSRGRAALARHTESVSNSTVGSFKQFFYEAEKIVKLLTTAPSAKHFELERLHRGLRELPLD